LQPAWFKRRKFRHLDVPVKADFVKKVQAQPDAGAHSFLPLIRYERVTKRYKPDKGKTEPKSRPVMYPSHRDACVLARYAHELGQALETKYYAGALSDCVIAYRKLGKANYHFAREVLDAAKAMTPCAILCFDVTKFFDSLDHGLLKRRLKAALGVEELPKDWYAIFRQMIKFHYLKRDDLKARLPSEFKGPPGCPIATIEQVKAAGLTIHDNPEKRGIPQGTPISSVLSNLYMVEFDVAMEAYCTSIGALYRRYCDDILVICPTERAAEADSFATSRTPEEKLTLNASKTERHLFDGKTRKLAQYLGFKLSADGATLRESSLSRQWRKLRRSVKKTMEKGTAAVAAGNADKVYTKALRRRFSPIRGRGGRPVRNFSSYARRAAETLESEAILHQVRRLEKALDAELGSLTNPPHAANTVASAIISIGTSLGCRDSKILCLGHSIMSPITRPSESGIRSCVHNPSVAKYPSSGLR